MLEKKFYLKIPSRICCQMTESVLALNIVTELSLQTQKVFSVNLSYCLDFEGQK